MQLKRKTLAEFPPKKLPKIGKAQKKIGTAQSLGYGTKNFLQYDHVEYPCFNEGN